MPKKLSLEASSESSRVKSRWKKPDKAERDRIEKETAYYRRSRDRELYGWSLEDCLKRDLHPKAKRIMFDGKRRKLSAVIKQLGLFSAAVYSALGRGEKLHKALNVEKERVKHCS